MTCIVSEIHSLLQHLEALKQNSEVYRQERCPCCGKSGVWRHGHYHRKSIRNGLEEGLSNPIQILRFFCSFCKKTHSVLPECLPPDRWYLWSIQQLIFIKLLAGESFCKASGSLLVSRSTCRRWWQRLKDQFLRHADALRTYCWELGAEENFIHFWTACFKKITLAKAMFLCHRQGVIVP